MTPEEKAQARIEKIKNAFSKAKKTTDDTKSALGGFKQAIESYVDKGMDAIEKVTGNIDNRYSNPAVEPQQPVVQEAPAKEPASKSTRPESKRYEM